MQLNRIVRELRKQVHQQLILESVKSYAGNEIVVCNKD